MIWLPLVCFSIIQINRVVNTLWNIHYLTNVMRARFPFIHEGEERWFNFILFSAHYYFLHIFSIHHFLHPQPNILRNIQMICKGQAFYMIGTGWSLFDKKEKKPLVCERFKRWKLYPPVFASEPIKYSWGKRNVENRCLFNSSAALSTTSYLVKK